MPRMPRSSGVPGRRAIVALALLSSIAACGDESPGEPSTGGVVLVVSTTGGDIDTDGYLVSLDGGAAVRVREGRTTLEDIDPGEHQLVVSDIADNCTLEGGNERAVLVERDEVAEASLDLTCTAYRGSIQVEVLTTGWDVDGDGYAVLVDGVEAGALDATSVHTVGAVDPIEHTVALANVAPNCAVVVPRVRNVIVDSLQVTDVAFRVYCAAASGPTSEQIIHSRGGGGLEWVRSDGFGRELFSYSPHIPDYPSWFPDRTRLAVSFYDAPREQSGGTLWSVPVSGAAPSQIGVLAGIEDPSWSPDGARLVYVGRRADPGLYVIGADGSGDVRITTHASDWMPAWSPDGSRIAFVRDDPPLRIYTVRPDGSELTPLPRVGSGSPLTPAWSPDGTRIAFAHYGPGAVLWVMNDDGTGLTQLTPPDFEAYENPTWSPTGDRLAMMGNRGEGMGIWTIRADGSELTFILPSTGGAPVWGR